MKYGAKHRGEGSELNGEDFFRLMVESVSDYSIFAINLEGRILSWNRGAEQVFGYEEGEIVGESFALLFTPEDRRAREPERELENASRAERVRDDRWRVRKDGSRLWVSGSLTQLKDESGKPIGFVKVARDATGRKRAEESLKKAEREREEALERE